MTPSNARDHEARTAEITEVDAFDESTLHQARLTVAGHSENTEEATLFMRMLGIHPDQDEDPTYGTSHPNLPTSAGKHVAHPLSSLANPLATNYPHTPPRILRTPPDRNFGTQFPTPLSQLRAGRQQSRQSRQSKGNT